MPLPLLRPWRPDDAAELRTAVATSPDLVTQLPVLDLTTEDGCRTFIDTQLAPEAEDGATLAITVAGTAVGSVGISAIDRRHGTAWLSYWVTTAARGKGLATAALATIADRAIDNHGLFRLELGHRVNNPSSCSVATRAGFVAEGVERAKLSYDGERFDVETHSRLRTDPWPGVHRLLVAEGSW
ncbi:GNAT family N-acetyltransferase [Serinibacter arcticus]|uniref:GNAT family N-acetyltransferase n=1 Tax=Serinibacter arcticus TaxID=1655435 RepID=A0A2U1ZUW1_9MICO|nr:GNAT family N-acetyltransferase [Serinibacter arcticus]PWD50787.1 GNAT family N-acetyltransferase [Serinibacter arcticus]